jgi:hypothetical protein
MATEFDNDKSLLLKAAVEAGVPSNYLFFEEEEENINIRHIRSANEIVSNARPTDTIDQLYEEVLSDLSPDDFAFLVYSIKEGTTTEELNEFLSAQKRETIKDQKDLNLRFHLWEKEWKDKLQKEQIKLEEILQIQQFLSTWKPMDYTPLIMDTERYEYVFSIDNVWQTFSESKASSIAPVIAFNTTPPRMKLMNDIPNDLWYLVPDSEELSEMGPQDLYLAVWLQTDEDITRRTRESFARIKISLNSNKLVLDIPVGNTSQKDLVLSRISEALPGITFLSFTQKNISGSYQMFDVEIAETSFVDMIMNDELFSNYLYVKETTNSFGEKKRLAFHFRGVERETSSTDGDEESAYSAVSVLLNPIIAVKGQEVKLVNNTQKKFETNVPSIYVSISKGADLRTVQQFMAIFARLVRYYLQRRDSIEEEYEKFIGDKLRKLLREPKKDNKSGKKISRNMALRKQAPDLIVTNYARKCQVNQPIIISQEEIPDWESKGHPVLPFPANESKYLFVCPDEEAPFPKIIKNELTNKDVYPYLPCCSSINEMDPKAESLYNKIYNKSSKKPEITGKSRHTLKSNKIIGFQRFGSLPDSIKEWVVLKNKDDQVKRMGVTSGLSSLLHCALLASGDAQYLKLTTGTDKQRETYVNKVRKTLFVQSGCLAQEMWDVEEPQRIKRLQDPTYFLSSELFIRALEIIFDFNIYVVMDSTELQLTLEQPRYRFFSARIFQDRPCMLVYKHSSDNEGIQYDLIVHENQTTKESTLQFDEQTNERLFRLWESLYSVKTWYMNEGKLEAIANIYSVGLLHQRTEAVSQILDSAGKLRGINLPSGLTIFSVPSQPLNLPTTTTWHLAESLKEAEKFMERKADQVSENMATFYFESVPHLYAAIPLKKSPMKITSDTSPVVLPTTDVNPAEAVDKKRQTVSILLQLLNIAFITSSQKQEKGFFVEVDRDVDSFLKKYTVVVENSHEFDWSEMLSPVLPVFKSWKEARSFLIERLPTFFQEDKIVVPTKAFREKIKAHLHHFLEQNGAQELMAPVYLLGPWVTNPSFNQSSTLIGDQMIDVWRLLASLGSWKVVTQLKPNPLKSILVYKEGSRYAIIGPSQDNLEQAKRTAQIWMKERRYEDEAEEVNSSVNVYTVNIKGTLSLLEAGVKNKKNLVVSVVKFDKDHYSPILSL